MSNVIILSVKHYIVTENVHNVSEISFPASLSTHRQIESIRQFAQVVTTDKVITTYVVTTTGKVITTNLRRITAAPLSRQLSRRLWILSAGSRNAATDGLLVEQSCHVHEDFWTWEVHL